MISDFFLPWFTQMKVDDLERKETSEQSRSNRFCFYYPPLQRWWFSRVSPQESLFKRSYTGMECFGVISWLFRGVFLKTNSWGTWTTRRLVLLDDLGLGEETPWGCQVQISNNSVHIVWHQHHSFHRSMAYGIYPILREIWSKIILQSCLNIILAACGRAFVIVCRAIAVVRSRS